MSTAELVREVQARRGLPAPAERRAIRESAGVSLVRMASAIGVHTATVHRWEQGSHEPRGQHLVVYAELLDQLRGLS